MGDLRCQWQHLHPQTKPTTSTVCCRSAVSALRVLAEVSKQDVTVRWVGFASSGDGPMLQEPPRGWVSVADVANDAGAVAVAGVRAQGCCRLPLIMPVSTQR
jgi:hypothetical protein